MKRFNANQYSAEWLRKQGFQCESTEQTVRIPEKGGPVDGQGKPLKWTMFKRDLFNFCDLICVKIGQMGTTYVQTTTAENVNKRLEKIAGLVVVRAIVGSGNRVHVHGWKAVKRGGVRSWQLTITNVTFDEDGLLQTEILNTESVLELGEERNQTEMDFANDF